MVKTLSVPLLKNDKSVLSSPPGTCFPLPLELFISRKFVYGCFIAMWLNILSSLSKKNLSAWFSVTVTTLTPVAEFSMLWDTLSGLFFNPCMLGGSAAPAVDGQKLLSDQPSCAILPPLWVARMAQWGSAQAQSCLKAYDPCLACLQNQLACMAAGELQVFSWSLMKGLSESRGKERACAYPLTGCTLLQQRDWDFNFEKLYLLIFSELFS